MHSDSILTAEGAARMEVPERESRDGKRRYASGFGAAHHGQEHGGASAIVAVLVSVGGDEVMLFKPDGDEDVRRGGDGKDEVAERHAGCGPEGNDEAEHDGVAAELVKHGLLETDELVLLALGEEVDLAQTEELKVIDHERA